MRSPQTALEARLRRYAETFDDEVPANGGFEKRILARLAVTDRVKARSPVMRELALGALVVLFVAVLGIGFAKLRADRSAAVSYVPSIALPPGPIDLGSNLTVPFFRMVSPEKGWAVGPPTSSSGEREAILLTDDGGRHWRNVTPPGFAANAPRTAYFLDASHAWVAVSPPFQGPPTTLTVTVYRTIDRARTWQSARVAIREGTGAGQVHFVDASHGWLRAATNNGDAIFRTADAGIHWTVASLMPLHLGGGPLDQAPDGSLPNNAPAPPASTGSQGPSCRLDSFVGLSFRDASTGWAAGDCTDVNAAYFYVTHDGGKTWTLQPLAYPEGYPGPCQCWTAITPPVFSSAGNGWFTLSLSTAITTCETAPQGGTGCATNTTPKLIVLYSTRDGGNTWLPTMLPASSGTVAFADASHGWFAGKTPQNVFDHLWVTADGGRNWTAVGSDVPLYPMELHFVSPSTGWSVDIGPSSVGQSILLQTVDGGHHWQRLMPTLTGPSS